MKITRILVVDDDVDNAELMVEVLKTFFKMDAKAAFSGKEALRLAPDFKPDVVFTDIVMHEMDGYEVSWRLKALLGQGLPVVALTGNGSQELSFAAGMQAHMLKPVEIETIAEVIITLESIC